MFCQLASHRWKVWLVAMAFISVWISESALQKLTEKDFLFSFSEYSQRVCFKRKQFSSPCHIVYWLPGHCNLSQTLCFITYLITFCYYPQSDKACGLSPFSARWAYGATFKSKKLYILFHMKLFSTYLIFLATRCDRLMLHRGFFLCYANAASSLLGWDAQLLLYVLLLMM